MVKRCVCKGDVGVCVKVGERGDDVCIGVMKVCL